MPGSMKGFTLYEGVASRESIDGIMKLGMNHPMGPLTLADFMVWMYAYDNSVI